MTIIDLNLSYNFASLSVRDLLEARDTYHYHLMNKANVIGTAVGLYLIRKDEDWPKRKGEGSRPVTKKVYARTLANSEVRDYSWPCIVVFVRSWEPEESFGSGRQYSPVDMVPKTLFLADGRAIPVCVVQATEAPPPPDSALPPAIPAAHIFGGGSAIKVHVQGQDHVATAGCLVSDGHLTYVLTARHACGEPGEQVTSLLRAGEAPIGESSKLQIKRKLFSEVYPDFPGRRTYVALDVGLVRLGDVGDWTSNAYGLPPIGPLADLHDHNVSLKLIDQPVIGFGAASGLLRGKVKGLFYRYRSVGGFDYTGDFLISPEDGPCTRPGDSGMIWHLDVTEDLKTNAPKPLADRDLRPLALEWGGQVFEEGTRRTAYAVATSLSGVCRLLDVELVTDMSRGVSGYWGRTGHYSIAAFAIELVQDTRLRDFMRKNAGLLSFDLAAIEQKDFDKMVGQLGNNFVPLADVPDEIWKKLDHGKNGRVGGRDVSASKTGSDGPEHPNHYADIDAKIGPHGETFRSLCLAPNSQKLSIDGWKQYYVDLAAKFETAGDHESASRYRKKFKQGLLPFRLWQFFSGMTDLLSQGDVVGYLAAAGTAAHYMGDASQPLHGSIYSDGDSSRSVDRQHPKTGATETVPYGKGVHSAFETAMLSFKAKDLIQLIQSRLPTNGHGLPLLTSGKTVARATIELMDKAATTLDPMAILDSYETAGASTRQSTLNAMWEDLNERTADVMILGARYLAMLWESAWAHGGGAAIAPAKLKELDRGKVRALYINPNFMPSLTLDQIETVLK